MDYSKMTKDELIQQLESSKHMATTIRSKDKKISELKNEVEALKSSLEKIKQEGASNDARVIKELMETNKTLVDENKEVFDDMRYLINVFNVFLSNFNNNTQLVQVLLRKYSGGQQ